MASFFQLFHNKEKKEILSENKSLTIRKEVDLKITKLKDDLKYYSTILEKEKKEIEKEIKEKKEKKKKKRRKKKNKYLSVNQRYKTKRNIDNIKKGLIINKNKLNRTLSNLKTIKKNENNTLIDLPKINLLKEKNPILNSFKDFKNEIDKKITNSNEYKSEKFVLNKIDIHNFKIKEKIQKEKMKIKKKLLIEKPKITINEVFNDISSMNGGHSNNYTSKYLMEVSKNNKNILKGIMGYDNNIIININIRNENKSISASVNKQNQIKNIRRSNIYLNEEKKIDKKELEINNNNFNNKQLEIDINNKKNLNNDFNNILKNKTNIYFNIRNKRKEELEKRFVRIRKEYKEKEYVQSIQNMKTYIYLILPGNASYLIKNCMKHRINWKEPFSSVTSLYNFKWQQISLGIDYNSLGNILNTKQIVNHFENHYSLTNKANMFLNMMEYCEKRKISVFKYVPFTIIFQFKDKTNYENNNEIIKRETNRIEILKEFINNYNNYIVNYDEIGNFYEDEKYQKEQLKRYTFELNEKKKKLKHHKKEEAKNNINNIYISDIKLYNDYFNQLKLKEKIQKIKKEKDGSYTFIEETINENIGKNTLIEIPNSHNSGYNLWIIKAINLNRGMCIKIVNSFEQIEETIKKFKEGVKFNFSRENIENKLKDTFFKNIASDIEITEEDEKNMENKDKIYYCSRIIIQKYIEKPLLYKKRKCDIRIWVLLTQLMKVYVFKEGHLKTCSIEYDLNSKNPYTHITNYSFQKHNNNFQKFEKGNEVPFYEFQKFINENYPEKNYKLNIDLMNKIKEIIYITMRSVRNKINKNNRNYQFEIFGYDFMLDENFNVFLIEINTNPGLEESSPWIKIIVPRMLDDALRLTIDQLFEPKYDFNLNYNNLNNFDNILNNFQENKNEKINNNNNEHQKYKSPFPVPGYELDDNLWDFVCDLNNLDPLDELIYNKQNKIDKKNIYSTIKHLL